ncbi:MAG: hypothetical protein RL745_544 [Actinomycetota bacterium]
MTDSNITQRLRLDLSYDGTNYAGWAKQLEHTTVQGLLEQALAVVLRLPEAPTTFCAGRTDSGVHAHAQVVHVDVPASSLVVSMSRLAMQLRGVLPEDIVVHTVSPAPAGFDARFSPLWRAYEYTIDDRGIGVDPLRRHQVVEHFKSLDESLMNDASSMLLGMHDFGAFCKPRERATTIRTLIDFTWSRMPDGLLQAQVQADAFCHSMVRFLVGSMIPVGEGVKPVDWPASMLQSTIRDIGFNLAPAHGLVLVEVRYPADDQLAARATQTRAMRDPLGEASVNSETQSPA